MADKPKRGRATSIRKALATVGEGENRKSVKIQLTLKPEWADRLHRLTNGLGHSSYSHTIRVALGMLEDLHDEVESGNQILSKDKDGIFYRIKIR